MTDKVTAARVTHASGSLPASGVPAFNCPKCQGVMRTYVRGGLVLELCEDCRGIFLDKGELERLIEAEGGGWSGIVTAALDPRS